MDLENVYLPDSWVVGIASDSTRVCFELDAVLRREHPRFYWPPKPGEHHAYARLRWCLHGHTRWIDGPNLDRPATDARGENDYGNIDSHWYEDNVLRLEGGWGSVAVRDAKQTVEYLDG
jgi:hypothetical protein